MNELMKAQMNHLYLNNSEKIPLPSVMAGKGIILIPDIEHAWICDQIFRETKLSTSHG